MTSRPRPRDALFSTSRRRPGTLVIDCGDCGARTRIGYAALVRASLPVPAWQPWRHHSRLIRCPVCTKRTWVAARWFD